MPDGAMQAERREGVRETYTAVPPFPMCECVRGCPLASGDGVGGRAGGHPYRQGCKQSTQGAALPPPHAPPLMLTTALPQVIQDPVERQGR